MQTHWIIHPDGQVNPETTKHSSLQGAIEAAEEFMNENEVAHVLILRAIRIIQPNPRTYSGEATVDP